MTAPRERWALAALLGATALLYLWNLSASGYGNEFYAAAAQAGSQSWSAWFFGSLDAHNFITVDKPPASLWVTGLSVRLFGMNSWAVLAPQAVMGVASVAVLYFTVRRAFVDSTHGAAAGLLAGVVLALTPAAAMMFRFNNPDALLVLLMTTAAYCVTRAVAAASWRWLALAGAVIGFAFLTKMLQAFLVLPGFALAYLLVAPTTWRRRALHVVGATAALVVAAGWWVLTVQLVPSTARPYVGGSTDNTVLELALGYNGLNRILGRSRSHEVSNWSGDGSGLAAFSGHAGLHRLFTAEMGNEIAWLLLVAVFALAFGVYLAARRQLSRGELCALVIWGSWLVVTAIVLSFMGGVVHPYYTVSMAPSIAALIGMNGVWAWSRRAGWDGRFALSGMLALAAASSAVLLHRNHFNLPWTAVVVALAMVGVAGVLMLPPRTTAIAVAIGVLAGLAGTATFSVMTTATPHHGSIPTAIRTSSKHGGWMDDESDNPALANLLAGTHTPWSAATNGSQSAAALEIASGTSVMAVGGWSGDPVPTLQDFIDDVHAGKVSYYVEAGRKPEGDVLHTELNHSASHTREIADWVVAHYRATTVGGSTVYRLA